MMMLMIVDILRPNSLVSTKRKGKSSLQSSTLRLVGNRSGGRKRRPLRELLNPLVIGKFVNVSNHIEARNLCNW